MPISSHTHIILLGHISYNWNTIGNFQIPTIFFCFYIWPIELWFLWQQTGASAKTKSAQSSGADAPQSSQAPPKRKAPKSTKTHPKRQKTTPSSPSSPPNQCPRRKQTWPTCLNRSSTQLTWAPHRPFPLSRQLLSLLKVKYQSQNRYRWFLL